MAQRRHVLVREDRVGQRHEAGHAVGQRPRGDRQPLAGHPGGYALQGAQAGVALEQEAQPDAGAIGRVGKQLRHGGRRHFHGRRCAVARPAPPRAADHTLVGPDLDLDEGGLLGAGRRVAPPATGTRTRIGRRILLFGAFFEPGPLAAAMAGRAALLAAPTPGARRLLLLALATEQRLRQRRPGRVKLRELRFQRLEAVPRCLRGPAQTGVLPGQFVDRDLLAPRSSQELAQLSVFGARRERPRRLGRAQQPGLQAFLRGLGGLQRVAQPAGVVGQRPDPVLLIAQFPRAVMQPHGLVQQPTQGVVLGVRLEQSPVKLAHLVVADLLRLLDCRLQLAPRCLEARLPRTRITTGGHFRPPQLLRARFRRLRPRPFPLIRQPPVAPLAHRYALGASPRPGGQSQGCVGILDAHRHGLDYSA